MVAQSLETKDRLGQEAKTKMQRRENAILAGVGTTRRKFVVSKDEKKKKKKKKKTIIMTTETTITIEEEEEKGRTDHREEEDLYVRVPAHRYMAIASGKLCKGKVNHKCLFSRDDTLDILCPDTVYMDSSSSNNSNGRATLFVHRSFKNRDILVQRNINTYMRLLCFMPKVVFPSLFIF